MSHYSSISENVKKITTHVLQEMKTNGEKISMLTAYDYSMGKLIDQAGVDVILVGENQLSLAIEV